MFQPEPFSFPYNFQYNTFFERKMYGFALLPELLWRHATM